MTLLGYRITKTKENRAIHFLRQLYNLIINGEWESNRSIVIEMWQEEKVWNKISAWREA